MSYVCAYSSVQLDKRRGEKEFTRWSCSMRRRRAADCPRGCCRKRTIADVESRVLAARMTTTGESEDCNRRYAECSQRYTVEPCQEASLRYKRARPVWSRCVPTTAASEGLRVTVWRAAISTASESSHKCRDHCRRSGCAAVAFASVYAFTCTA